MELFLPIMRTSPLFAGMEEEEIRAILGCLDARVERYPKGAYLLRVGDTVESVGLLLAGGALVTQESFWGSRNIMARIGPGQLFAEAFAC